MESVSAGLASGATRPADITKAIAFIASVLPIHRQPNQGTNRQAGWAFCHVWFGIVEPRGPRNVQVHPGRFLGELLEEKGRRDCTSPASSDVGDIGKCTLQ